MGTPSELMNLKNQAIDAIKNYSTGFASRVGAQIFLCRCDEMGLGKYDKWLMFEKRSLVQAIAAPYLNFRSSSGKDAASSFLARSTVDTYLGLVNPMIKNNVRVLDLGKDPTKFPIVAQYVFNAAGLSGHKIASVDAISNLVTKRYSVTKWKKWRKLLQGEYQHAHMIFQNADTYFDTHLSAWLNYQDSFNEIIFRAFQDFLKSKQAPGAIRLQDKKGNLVDYGRLLNDSVFKTAYPNLQDDLAKLHNRRNRLPGSHPYDKRTGKKALPLKKKEQGDLKSYLEDALNEIISIVEKLGI